MAAPNDAYYEMLEERLPGHGHRVRAAGPRNPARWETAGGKPRLLLQIFSETLLGPVFFEFIQRKGDDGFGRATSRPFSSRSSATRSAAVCCRRTDQSNQAKARDTSSEASSTWRRGRDAAYAPASASTL